MHIRHNLFQSLLAFFLVFLTACGSAEFSEAEKETHRRAFFEKFEDSLSEVVEYEFGDTKSFAVMAALYRDPANLSETVFAFLTVSGGSGYLNLVDGPNDFVLDAENGMTMEQEEDTSIFCFRLLSEELQISRDYKVRLSPTEDGTYCSIECSETAL